MHTAGRGLTGDGADDVARCGAVLVGPADAAVAPCGEWWARLLVGAAFRHLCAVGGGRLPAKINSRAAPTFPASSQTGWTGTSASGIPASARAVQ